MRKNYTSPELEMIRFFAEDILSESDTTGGTGGLIPGGGSQGDEDESKVQPFG